MSLLVVETGALTLVQDGGRPGLWSQGVGTAGAFDRTASRQANTVLGNSSGAAVLEVLGGGLRLRAEARLRVVVTGAVGPLSVEASPVTHGRAITLGEGQELTVAPFTVGMRAYVAVSGGLEVEPVLGSRSADTMSGLGPAALSAGDRLEVGDGPSSPEIGDVPALLTSGTTTVEAVVGPRDDWFDDAAVQTFFSAAWHVSPRSDRIGVRLAGPALTRSDRSELPSEPCVRGSVQVTADGQPVVLGPDHPVTGGYPVVAVVVDADVDRLAQVRPGDVVRFVRRPAP